MSRHRRQRFQSVDIWPAFVDVLSTLLIITIFALLVFILSQFVLGRTLSSRDETIEKLNARTQQLSELLALEQAEKSRLELSLATLEGSLTQARDEAEAGAEARAKVPELSLQIEQLTRQLAALQEALEASETRSREQEVAIEVFRAQLNAALAEKVQELRAYRSEFFGRLRALLGERDDIRVVGDRFVFQSEVLFPTGSATLEPEGEATLGAIAETLLALSAEIPKDLDWILRVDGHTDKRPISTAQFHSNWELSSARAISVVNFLIDRGVPAERLVAAGFGSGHPLDTGDTDEALTRNRRIELKLDQR
ncbi:peptidoglycan -binding protein [Phaeovibrio sulfidiphilus]|uniref:Peptidoglycan -binding protein n=1 Tax=Phaeovibrio sulfidiphilus TaxID=1220600 RepID=A0A8J6YUA4_9PROT|nr:peptidoglycan -binding protein [Phaeovibrio sulfidiphilus]MBE1236524.1 peptidoglycan -binding protein [Phaeovibrio sulfidiphilus]